MPMSILPLDPLREQYPQCLTQANGSKPGHHVTPGQILRASWVHMHLAWFQH